MTPVSEMKVKELKEALKARGLKTVGPKAELAARLKEALAAEDDSNKSEKPAEMPSPGEEVPAAENNKSQQEDIPKLQDEPYVSPLDSVMKEIALKNIPPKELVLKDDNENKKEKTWSDSAQYNNAFTFLARTLIFKMHFCN